MDSSLELDCCVNAIFLATAPPLIVSCHRALSKRAVAHETFRRAESECCSSHSALALSYVRAHRGRNDSRERPRIGAGWAAAPTFGLQEDATAAPGDLRDLAYGFASQPKILPHFGSLVRFHCRLHLVGVAYRSLHSSRRHLIRVIRRLLLPSLWTMHQSRVRHILSQVQ